MGYVVWSFTSLKSQSGVNFRIKENHDFCIKWMET